MELREEKRLKAIAVRAKVPLSEVKAKYQQEYGKLSYSKSLGDKAQQRIAVNKVMNYYRVEVAKKERPLTKAGKYPVKQIVGFNVGDMGIFDKVQVIRDKIKKFIENNSMEAAIEQQLINGDGQILDQRPKIYGRDNPNYLHPLDPNLKVRSRTLLGFWRINGDKTWKYGTIQTDDNALAKGWDKVKFFTPCQTFASIREEGPATLTMGSSSAKETLTVFKAVKEEIDVQSVIMDSLKKQFTEINEVEKLHETFKDAWDRKIFLHGVVAWINLERPTPFGSVYAGLMDPDEGLEAEQYVRILIPDHIKVDFGEGSEIVVFGKTRRSKTRNEEGKLVDGDVIVDVHGIYPVPGLATVRESSTPLSEEQEIDGWVE